MSNPTLKKMKNSNDKKYYYHMVKTVQQKLAALPENGYIRTAISTDKIDKIAKKVELKTPEDLRLACWPPLFIFLHNHSIPEIQELESDIGLIVSHSNRRNVNETTQFLHAGPKDDRLWIAGLFETFVKVQCVKKIRCSVELDYPLQNGRNTDIRFEMGGNVLYLECTVITESDEDRNAWDKFIKTKKSDSNAILVRPGNFDPPNAKGPSPYYDALRIYAKVYDKLAKDLDPKKSQMGTDGSNILLISCFSPRGPLSATSPGVGWALDELFACQPRSGTRLNDQSLDISLLSWLDFTANDLNKKAHLDFQKYIKERREIIASPRKIGAILLFDGCVLKASRVNYNANNISRLSHREIVELEKIFEAPPDYC